MGELNECCRINSRNLMIARNAMRLKCLEEATAVASSWPSPLPATFQLFFKRPSSYSSSDLQPIFPAAFQLFVKRPSSALRTVREYGPTAAAVGGAVPIDQVCVLILASLVLILARLCTYGDLSS